MSDREPLYLTPAERARLRVQAAKMDPRPRLDPKLLPGIIRTVFQTATRRELDALTRRLWKRYNSPQNAKELETLKARILERRAQIDRANPR